MAMLLLISSMLVMTSCGGDEGGEGDGGSSQGGGNDNGGEGGDEVTKLEYKVTVKDQNGAAVAGASILVLKSVNGANVPTSTTPTLTGDDGIALFNLEEGSYTAMIMGGDNYKTEGSTMKQFGANRGVSFSVITEEVKEKLTYTIKVVDQDGNAIAGVSVQACIDACTPFPKATDANGESSHDLEVADGEYKAQLSRLPDGYTEQIDEDNNPLTLTKYSFDENRCVTIVLVKD